MISGRELVVQSNSSEFRQPEEILHILPYFLTKYETKNRNYIDSENLLAQDQRQLWWQNYGKAKGDHYSGLPSELNQGNLTEITAQPLLNYLVALSFGRGEVNFSQDSNLNTIYADLLKAVYKRGWTGYQHPSIQGIQERDFVRILEEIALASWHGDGRTTTVINIESHCDNSGLKRLLENFQEGAKLGVTRLLTAFYFRHSELNGGEKTFEFTHKSFGEYLTARRIVRGVKRIHEELEDRQKNLDKGWDEKEALVHWAILCGSSPMDEYLFNFVVNEMGLQDKTDVASWQKTLCKLIRFMLRYGMPMEKLNLPTFHQANQQARNAEEALLAVLNACARITRNISQVEWPSPEAFGTWISRLQRQRLNEVFCLDCLSFLGLQNCILIFKDFYHANLKGANLKEANLERANLKGANLERVNLERANLRWANLERVNLERANLERANLERANLERANLEQVNLERANLERAKLEGANLERANLQRANLGGANLQRANLRGANLRGANLRWAKLEEAKLEEAKLEGAKLRWAKLEGAKLEGANLRGVKLEGANVKGTILESKDSNNLDQHSGVMSLMIVKSSSLCCW